MPRDITVTFADGTAHTYQGAPDDVTPDAVQARAEKQFAKTVKGIDGGTKPAQAAPEPSFMDKASDALQTGINAVTTPVNNQLMGLVRGAARIGTTLLAPTDYLQDALAGDRGKNLSSLITGVEKPSRYAERKQDIEGAMTNLGADKSSIAYQSGDLNAQVLGTAGVGGALGAVAKVLKVAAPVVESLTSAGFKTGQSVNGALSTVKDAAIRAFGGAATGAASAGLVDPTASSVATGGAVGAVLPGAIQALGASGSGVANLWRKYISAGDKAGAQALEKIILTGTPQEKQAIIDKLRNAPELVPGSGAPTVAQALQTPEASIVSRVVHDTPGGAQLRSKIAQQAEARTNALEAVAPTDANGFTSARADMGNAITSRVIPEEKNIGKQISKMYEGIDPTGAARVELPIGQMNSAVEKYLGPGTFGGGGDPQRAVATAKAITSSEGASTLLNNPGVPTTTWRETQRLRSSMGEAIQRAKEAGNKQEAAALTSQLGSLDSTIDRIANGGGKHGEVFTPEMSAAWKDANAAFANKMDRFHTGPQAAIFRQRNGEPGAEGAKAAQIFWGQGPKAAENVQSFRKLVEDNPDMLGRFKSMITTQGAGTADASQQMTTKFSKWVSQSLPGLREAFSPAEVQQMQNIAADIDRAAKAAKLGTSQGGSNTYQNAANALSLGVLDSPAMTKAANAIPGVRLISGPMLEGVKGYARSAKAQQLANLLSDSHGAADALEALNRQSPEKANELLRLLGQGAARSGPVAVSR